MLNILVILCIIACAAFMLNEGVYSAAIILACTVIGGLIAFNFYEYLGDTARRNITVLGRYAHFITLMLLFGGSVTLLRMASEYVAPMMVQLPDMVHRGGGVILGAWMGWILAGILICGLQMLPLHKNFLGYDYRLKDTQANGFNADRYWLAFVHRASTQIFEKQPVRGFDPQANFVIRYYHQRYGDAGFTNDPSAGGAPAPEPRARPRGRGRRSN